MEQLEAKLQGRDSRERELVTELEQARELQLVIAAKMKEDMRLVKDEWQAYAEKRNLS